MRLAAVKQMPQLSFQALCLRRGWATMRMEGKRMHRFFQTIEQRAAASDLAAFLSI
jgi:hypothetical protein